MYFLHVFFFFQVKRGVPLVSDLKVIKRWGHLKICALFCEKYLFHVNMSN